MAACALTLKGHTFRNFIFFLFIVSLHKVESQRCPYGWLNGIVSNSCYLITHDDVPYTWHDARERCHTFHAELVVLKTVEERNILLALLRSMGNLYKDVNEWWIGLTNQQDGKDVLWVDGTNVDPQVINWRVQPDTKSQVCGRIFNGTFDAVKCSFWRHFICERSKDVPISCETDDGWKNFDNKCFKLIGRKLNFYEAANQCQINDATLASVPDDTTQTYFWGLTKYNGANTWIGLSSTSKKRPVIWKWSNGTEIGTSLSFWKDNGSSQALVPKANQTCVEIVTGPSIKRRFSWMSADCSERKEFICEKPQGVCQDGWLIHQKTCYQINARSSSSWINANKYCTDQGGTLLKITSAGEQLFISSNLLDQFRRGGAGIWLGATDDGAKGPFKWSDGSPISTFTNWQPLKPKNSAQKDCGFIDTDDTTGRWQITDDCTQLKSFICQLPVNQPVRTVTIAPEEYECEKSWTVFSSSCYKLFDEDSTWLNARKSCQDASGDLVRISDSETQSFLLGQIRQQRGNYWIGLHDRHGEGNFTWLEDSTVAKYTYWDKGQPNNLRDNENCVFMEGQQLTGKWKDYQCPRKLNFICQKPAHRGGVPTPKPSMMPLFNPKCGYLWEDNPHTPYCYQFSDELLTWDDAADTCKHHGGTLASITSTTEQFYISGRLKSFKILAMWIGASDRSEEGGWKWEDGSPFAYLNWDAGEPNNYGDKEDCAAIFIFTSKWNDYRCNKRRGYICKKLGMTVATPSSPPPTTPSVPAGKYYGCPPGWKGYLNNCYLVVRTPQTWSGAKDYCQENGGSLASITNREENNFIFSETPAVTCTNIYKSDTKCTNWAKSGECMKNPIWMGKNCRSACSLCYKKCENKNKKGALCENWAKRGECTKNPAYMLRNCMQSCKMCDGGEYDAVWIGMYHDKNALITFSWVDGSSVTYTNWDTTEPNNFRGNDKDCVKMFTQKAMKPGGWSDDDCDAKMNGFVCKTQKSVQSVVTEDPLSIDCPKNAKGYENYCYQFVGTQYTWSDAEANCVKLKGHLATVNGRFVQAFLSAELVNKDAPYWIGLSDTNSPGTYQWTSRRELDFTFWESFHTGNEKSTCVAMNTSHPVGMWTNQNCTALNPSICESLKDGVTTLPITTVPPTVKHVPCNRGWVEYLDNCYKAYTKKLSWLDARQYCVDMGADLASIHNASAQTVIKSSMNRYLYRANYWIGLNDRGTEGRLVWSDGTPLDFTSWGSQEPNDVNGREDCVELRQSNLKWNDNNCYIANNFVCMIARGMNVSLTTAKPVTTKAPIPCADDGWTYFNGSCYFVSNPYGVDAKKSWYDSRRYCQQYGGDLLSIHSAEEDDYVLSKIKSRSSSGIYWIGLNDLEGGYRWTDGSVVSYKSWTKGEPNDAFGGQRCVNFYSLSGDWNDDNCMDRFGFICKKLNSSTTPAPTTPTPIINGGCPVNFKVADNSNKCFFVGGLDTGGAKDWESARNACRSIGHGADIASIHNYMEHAFLLTLLRKTVKTGVWIGLFDKHVNGLYTWSDNSEVTFTNWAKGEPSDHWSFRTYNREDCVEIALQDGKVGKWNDRKCGDIRPYVCQASRDVRLPKMKPQTSTLGCKLGYVPFGTSCYKLVTQPKTWSAAQSSCVSETANLVSIFAEYDQAFVDILTSNLPSPYWIGLSDTKVKGVYSWSDGWPRLFSKWGGDEPSRGDGEGCVAVMDRKWNDTMCNASYPYICMINTEPPPPTTPMPDGRCADPTWTLSGDFCYYVQLTDTKSWPEARYVCEKKGMKLASIQDEDEMALVKSIVQAVPVTTRRYFSSFKANTRIWLGLSKVEKGGFQWSDDTATLYLNWAKGEPSDTNSKQHEDCVEMYQDSGFWNDVDCFGNKGFVCKAKKISILSTATTSTSKNPTSKPVDPDNKPSKAATSNTGQPALHTADPTRAARIDVSKSPIHTWGPSGSSSRLANPPDDKSGLTGGQVAGIVIGVIGFSVIIVVFLIVVKRHRHKLPIGFGSVGFDNALYNQSIDPADTYDVSEYSNSHGVIRIGQIQD